MSIDVILLIFVGILGFLAGLGFGVFLILFGLFKYVVKILKSMEVEKEQKQR